VVKAEDVEDRGMKVIDSGDVLDGLVAEFIRCAETESLLYACAGEPCGKAVRVVVATARAFLEGGHAAEFRAPHDERVGEQAALLEVGEERGSGLVHHFAVLHVLLLERLVAVPIAHAFAAGLVCAVEELHEAHAFLHEPAREDAVARVGGLEVLHGIARLIGTIHFQNVRGLRGNVRDLRDRQLHARGEFVAGDAGGEFRVAGEAFEVVPVQRGDEFARGAIGRW
jgi:hypothetical protein